jgi:hypothetical protein
MLRTVARRFSVDTPFRYGFRHGVSPHIRSKDFGKDVLIFANPVRLDREASSILSAPSDLSETRSKAYWEIFAKRTNESIHLLEGSTICKILRAFEATSNRRDLLVGICHMVFDNISNSPVMSKKYRNFQEVVTVIQYLTNYLVTIPDTVYWKMIEALVDTIYQVQSVDEVILIVKQIQILKKDRQSDSAAEKLMYRLLVSKMNELKHFANTDEYTLEKLLDMVNSP